MDWYEMEVRALVTRLAAQHVLRPSVLYGSSSITLWSTVARDLGDERAVNAGFGGSTLEACAHFFDRIVPPLRPAALLVYAGDNDLGDGRSPEHVAESFRRLAERCDATCGPIPLGFISIKPSPSRAGILERIRHANELVRAQVESRPNGFFVPMFEYMLRGGAPRPELFTADGLHLNRAGYTLWTQLLEPFRPKLFPAPPAAVTPDEPRVS